MILQAEPDNAFDVLRIIAKDTPSLPKADREAINSAADELENTQRMLVKMSWEHLQLQQRLMAVNDQLIEARKGLANDTSHDC